MTNRQTGTAPADSGARRVLVVAEVFPPRHGGSGRWLWDLYRRLDDDRIIVLAGHADGDEAFDRTSALAIRRAALSFPTWGLLSPAGVSAYAGRAVEVVRLARSVHAEALHAAKTLPEGLLALAAARWLRIPFWCFAHGEELTLAGTSRELRWLTGMVLGRAAGVVANSENTRRILESTWQVEPRRIVVAGPGVDTTRFVPALPDPGFREQRGWMGRRVVLTVGALQKRKGQDTMIRALPRIRRRCPDVLYVMAGEGWERSYLEGLVREHGAADAVQFAGTPPEDELLRMYQQCEMFALPNRQIGWDFEGFGIVLLEAQACGRPVITGASGGTGEAMLPDETGLRLSCENPAELADACISLLEDPDRRAAMGARAREWVVERFDWNTRVAEARRGLGLRA